MTTVSIASRPSTPVKLDWRLFAFTLIAVLHFANAFADLFNRPLTTEMLTAREPSNPLYTYSFGLVHLAALLLILPVWQSAKALLRRNLWIVFLVGLALVSSLWSLSPSITIRRGISMLGSFALVLYLAIRISPADYMRVLKWMALIFVYSTPLIVFLLPAYGKGAGVWADAWRGITAHKNGLGWMMVLSIVIMTYAPRLGVASRKLSLFTVLLAFICLVMAKSSTGFLAMFVAASIFCTIGLMRQVKGHRLLVGLMLLSLIGCVALVAGPISEAVLAALGKNPTLSGRTAIWDQLFLAMAERPLLGWGYRAFWESNYAAELMSPLGFFAGHAHNGYLDMIMDLGLIGLVIYVTATLIAIVKLLLASLENDDFAACQLVMMLTCLFIGFSGPVVLRPNTIYFILTCAPILYASRLGRALTPARPAGRGLASMREMRRA